MDSDIVLKDGNVEITGDMITAQAAITVANSLTMNIGSKLLLARAPYLRVVGHGVAEQVVCTPSQVQAFKDDVSIRLGGTPGARKQIETVPQDPIDVLEVITTLQQKVKDLEDKVDALT